MKLPNIYETSGPEADDAATLIAELWNDNSGALAFMMLQPNPRLYLAAHLEWIAGETDKEAERHQQNPATQRLVEISNEEASRLRKAAATLRKVSEER